MTHPALIKAIKRGSLKLGADGMLDGDQLRGSEWWRNHYGAASEKAKPSTEEPIKSGKLGIEQLLSADKIQLEKLLILERRESLRLENDQRRGNLVKTAEVRDRWLSISSQIRNRLLLLPCVVASKLLGKTNPAEIETILDSEIRIMLSGLSEITNAA